MIVLSDSGYFSVWIQKRTRYIVENEGFEKFSRVFCSNKI